MRGLGFEEFGDGDLASPQELERRAFWEGFATLMYEYSDNEAMCKKISTSKGTTTAIHVDEVAPTFEDIVTTTHVGMPIDTYVINHEEKSIFPPWEYQLPHL